MGRIACIMRIFHFEGTGGLMSTLHQDLLEDPIIHSVVTDGELEFFLDGTDHKWACLKNCDINTLEEVLSRIRSRGKRALLHLDSIKGVARDREGIEYLQAIGVEAVVAMRSQHIADIRHVGMDAVLGSFLIDSSAILQTVKNLKAAAPDAALIMPMTVPCRVYDRIRKTGLPILAGGMGLEPQYVQYALDAGASGCIVTDRKSLTERYRR